MISTFGNADSIKQETVGTGAHYTWFYNNNKDLRKIPVQTIKQKKRQVRTLDALFLTTNFQLQRV
jgi:hypothetical protein